MRNLCRFLVFAGLPAIGTLFPSPVAWGRTWTDSAGGKAIEADYILADSTRVVLGCDDGRVFTVPISRLCEEDQAHIAARRDRAPSENAQPSPFRLWLSAGGHRFYGELADIRGDAVMLKPKKGEPIAVPIAELCEGDRSLLESADWKVVSAKGEIQVVTTGQITISMSSDGSTQTSGIQAVARLTVHLSFPTSPGRETLQAFRLMNKEGRVLDSPFTVKDGTAAVLVFDGWKSTSGLYLFGLGRRLPLESDPGQN